MSELDEIDRKILRLLRKDAGRSLETLSDVIGLSKNACWRRIKSMEDAGLITGRIVTIDAEKLGLSLTAIVMIRSAEHSGAWLKRFTTALHAMQEVESAERMSGDWDYLLRVRLRDMKDYDRFYKRLISAVPVNDISASFVMEELKPESDLPI